MAENKITPKAPEKAENKDRQDGRGSGQQEDCDHKKTASTRRRARFRYKRRDSP